MTPDTVHGYLNAGRSLSPWLDHAVWFVLWIAPGVLFVTGLLAIGGAYSALHHAASRRRERRYINRGIDRLLDAIHNQPREEKP